MAGALPAAGSGFFWASSGNGGSLGSTPEGSPAAFIGAACLPQVNQCTLPWRSTQPRQMLPSRLTTRNERSLGDTEYAIYGLEICEPYHPSYRFRTSSKRNDRSASCLLLAVFAPRSLLTSRRHSVCGLAQPIDYLKR